MPCLRPRKMREAQFEVLCDRETPFLLVIKDIGPWDKYPTVTNDIEGVVRRLYKQGLLVNGKWFNVVDSDGNTDSIIHEDGEFVSFALDVERIKIAR